MRMRSGELRQTIQIERDQITRVSGAETSETVIVATTQAKAEALKGAEAWRAQQVAAGVDWAFTVRYEWRDTIRSSDRIFWRDESYEIKAVLPDEIGRRSLELLCKNINAK